MYVIQSHDCHVICEWLQLMVWATGFVNFFPSQVHWAFAWIWIVHIYGIFKVIVTIKCIGYFLRFFLQLFLIYI